MVEMVVANARLARVDDGGKNEARATTAAAATPAASCAGDASGSRDGSSAGAGAASSLRGSRSRRAW